jgi:hypothetical protein
MVSMRLNPNRTMGRSTAAFALVALLAVGCGDSNNSAGKEAFRNLPHYPGAVASESLEQSTMLGVLSGELVQMTTSDGFDEVLDFYTAALAQQDVEVLNHSSDLGRQTAISIREDTSVVSVAIQEFASEGELNITLMRVGS